MVNFENSDDRIECIFLKTREFGNWSMKIVLIPCINTVHFRICLKIVFIFKKEIH